METVDDDEPRLRLTFGASLKALWRLDPPGYGKKGDIDREIRVARREREAALDEMLVLEAEKRRGHILRDRQLWAEPGTALKRHRAFGHHQTRVIAVLVRYAAEDPQMGLPKEAVQEIAAQGSGVYAERVIDRLLKRGTLQQSRDGTRVRLTDWRLSWVWKYTQFAVSPPLDDAKAEAVLKRCVEDGARERKGPLRGQNQRGAFKRP